MLLLIADYPIAISTGPYKMKQMENDEVAKKGP